MNIDERTLARAALISGIRIPELIDELDGKKYRDLVDEHRRRLDGRLSMIATTHEQMVEPCEREAATAIVGELLNEASTPSFWSCDAGEVLARVSCDLNDALFPDEAAPAGVFNLFRMATIRLADRMRLDPTFREMVLSAPAEAPRVRTSGQITRMIGIAISDHEHERLSEKQLLRILQESIDSGDILAEDNEPYVATYVMPLIASGTLAPSPHITEYLNRRMAASRQQRPWWRFWT